MTHPAHASGPQRRLPAVEERSAGGVVVDVHEGEARIAVIARRNRAGRLEWCLPKGHIEGEETLVETAAREVAEETGIEARVLVELGTIDYWFATPDRRIHKFVHHYLLEAIGDVLGDAVTPEVARAWGEVYWLFAVDLISAEAKIYQQIERTPDTMLSDYEIVEIRDAGADARTFRLAPLDGSRPPAHVPGQYVSVVVQLRRLSPWLTSVNLVPSGWIAVYGAGLTGAPRTARVVVPSFFGPFTGVLLSSTVVDDCADDLAAGVLPSAGGCTAAAIAVAVANAVPSASRRRPIDPMSPMPFDQEVPCCEVPPEKGFSQGFGGSWYDGCYVFASTVVGTAVATQVGSFCTRPPTAA